jgi:hypothetical protein
VASVKLAELRLPFAPGRSVVQCDKTYRVMICAPAAARPASERERGVGMAESVARTAQMIASCGAGKLGVCALRILGAAGTVSPRRSRIKGDWRCNYATSLKLVRDWNLCYKAGSMSRSLRAPLSRNVTFEALSSQVLTRLKERSADPEWKSAVPMVTKVAKALVRLKMGSRAVTAELEVPKEIAKALSAGGATRTGSVVRMVRSGRILKHLKEVKPSHVRKLLKSPTLAFVVVDAFQSALLNEKLADIQLQLKEIDRKLHAQQQGLLRKALEQMLDLPDLKGRNRWLRIHQIQDSLREFEGIHRSLCDSRWDTIQEFVEQFQKARLTNVRERKRLCEAAQDISRDVEMIANAKILHARMTIELDETQTAEQEMLRLEDFLLGQEVSFNAVFGEDASIQDVSAHRVRIGRAMTARNAAREQLVEPRERLDHLLNSSLLLHLAIGTKSGTRSQGE